MSRMREVDLAALEQLDRVGRSPSARSRAGAPRRARVVVSARAPRRCRRGSALGVKSSISVALSPAGPGASPWWSRRGPARARRQPAAGGDQNAGRGSSCSDAPRIGRARIGAGRHEDRRSRRYVESPRRMRRRVTFSRNLTLSLSRTCRCYCKYCAFATHQPHLHAPEEVQALLDRAVSRHHVKELLVLTGEKPEVNPEVARRLAEYGHEDFTSLCGLGLRAGARARSAAAHEPRGARARGSGAAARGDGLAGADARVGVRAADGDRSRRVPDQAPGAADRDDPRPRAS